jgi:ribosomal protein S18 acetylase RimI-like enzyme
VEIICRQGEPVGCFALGRHDDHLYVARIALLARWQRRGIGTALLRRVIAEADERRLPVRLSVLENNPARRLYERLGFTVVEDRHPKLVMERPAS